MKKLWVILFCVSLALGMLHSCNNLNSTDSPDGAGEEQPPSFAKESSSSESETAESDIPNVVETIDNIIVEEKEYTLYLSDEYDFNAPNSTTKPIFPAVVLTNSQVQSVPPTLVREGDTFLGWKAMSVEAGYIYYDDGRMYPQYGSGVIVEFEGELTIKAQFDYFNDYEKVIFENDGLFITPTSEYQELFPMVYNEGKGYITTFCGYGLDGMSWDEIRELLNYKHGIYECEVTIRDYKLNRVPVGGCFNMATIVDMSVLSVIEYHNSESGESYADSNAENSNDPTKEFFKTDPTKGTDYNAAIEAYNEFLSGETDAVYKDKDETLNISVILEDRGGSDNVRYSIFDMNGDGIPELLTFSAHYLIYSYQDGKVVFWFDVGNNQHGPIDFLENGAVFVTHQTTGTLYRYITFGLDGNVSEVTFGLAPVPEDEFENEWNAVNDEYGEYFSLAKKIAPIEWQLYWK